MTPDNILRCMNPSDRKAMGKAGMTQCEATAINVARLEKEIHTTLGQWLRLNDFVFIHSRTDKRSTQEKGVPDFIIMRNNRVLCIECKLPSNKLQPDQEAFKAKLERNGMPLHIAYDAETCIELVRTFFRI